MTETYVPIPLYTPICLYYASFNTVVAMLSHLSVYNIVQGGAEKVHLATVSHKCVNTFICIVHNS